MAARPNQIVVDLKQDKQAWQAWCAARGVTSSEALRQVIRKLLASPQPEVGLVAVEKYEAASVRRWINLTASEFRKVSALAEAEGFSVPRWIVAVIRSRLTQAPQFGQAELEALAQSNLQLLAIGRNLNQIARAFNTDPRQCDPRVVELVSTIDQIVKNHTQKVSNLMASNTERWGIK